jgi:transposase
MAAPRKFDEETRARAVRMYLERVESGESKLGARTHVGELLDILPATIRNWLEAEERRIGGRSLDANTVDWQQIRELKREIAELRRANEILKTASAFFAAAELDRRLK